ncbi:MAG TPA: tRNA uridine-5-carboxymethylaminomethyl(34) synthesis GTPase MnmE [Chitinophagales bacterium]|jgi:tRNA modification GTPase|nr:tRNA uridine-5-carboxymethylaminomethyl(34) synthesis GTPase MnmE [Chitinophagales bacterium]MBP6154847.1 tRNA uridine-5-carboxymethylaminomethyl(34) synthesis GTPase MnmE [Chitinophagales bacterium]HQV78275.1 tRNA uridine-5-carboxymethylaminomethyl(34) synthesis GTPase MnmE [Chitinophagales bacterium]HQW80155.1 tRNA uridine-5-carboxymethylaminomethyl(34) synthesis GTPase MnmE [Chitinophagales bacterium]HRB93020.1 tRNA uridine-5-carboxymethylaminomethyl(34) synthesis GTPase MnmE [Chitinophag
MLSIDFNDTIIAIATPLAVGAIGVIRVSGKDTFSIVNEIFKGKNLTNQASHTVHLGKIVENEEVIDEVLISIFIGPNSYTKEDVIEISCHGSPYILNRILQLLILKGARMANQGEFTQRAYINGRFDLSQAEAVADLIASDSQAAHKVAMQQMRGGISSKLKDLRNSLIEFTALIELELDFAEEDVEFADRTHFVQLLEHIKSEIKLLITSFKFGNAIKNGIPVAIVGKPNAGKSTLLNALLEEERAIVSEIAGTTRDTVEETLTISGYLFRFIDTAGLRETSDVIEKIGVERSKESILRAEIVLYLFDQGAENLTDILTALEEIPKSKKLIVIGNKQDKYKLEGIKDKFPEYISISAKENEGIPELKTFLVQTIEKEKVGNQDAVVISNYRHFEALQNAGVAIDIVLQNTQQNIPTDLISQDIKTALRFLGQITGEIDVDRDILSAIFSRFCIGK